MNHQELLFLFTGLAIIAFSIDTISCRSDAKGTSEQSYITAVELYSKNDLSGALLCVRKIAKADRGFLPAQLLEGKILFFSNDLAGAKKLFGTLARKRPQYTEACLWYIRTLVISGDYRSAKRELDRQLSFNISDWRFYYQYALLARATNENEMRISMLNRAAAYLEESGKVYVDLAKTWYSLGMQDRSLRYLEKAENVVGTDTDLFAGIEKLRVSILKEKGSK